MRELRLNAINMPAEWGGQGLGVLDQVLVSEELGVLTNALWDTVWRPANALRACSPEQRAAYLEPAIRGERRDCFAVTEPGAGSDPSLIQTTAEPVEGGYRLNGEKWFVTVGDVADFLIVLALVLPERSPTLFLVDKDTPGVQRAAHAALHAYVRVRASGVRLRGRARVRETPCWAESARATSSRATGSSRSG